MLIGKMVLEVMLYKVIAKHAIRFIAFSVKQTQGREYV